MGSTMGTRRDQESACWSCEVPVWHGCCCVRVGQLTKHHLLLASKAAFAQGPLLPRLVPPAPAKSTC